MRKTPTKIGGVSGDHIAAAARETGLSLQVQNLKAVKLTICGTFLPFAAGAPMVCDRNG